MRQQAERIGSRTENCCNISLHRYDLRVERIVIALDDDGRDDERRVPVNKEINQEMK